MCLTPYLHTHERDRRQNAIFYYSNKFSYFLARISITFVTHMGIIITLRLYVCCKLAHTKNKLTFHDSSSLGNNSSEGKIFNKLKRGGVVALFGKKNMLINKRHNKTIIY